MGRRRITVQITLEPYLVELGVVEGTERLRRAPERSDMAELHSGHVSDETELPLCAKLRPPSVSLCTSTSGYPVAISRVFKARALYAAHVRSPILFATSKA
jgi:hypothetical protein